MHLLEKCLEIAPEPSKRNKSWNFRPAQKHQTDTICTLRIMQCLNYLIFCQWNWNLLNSGCEVLGLPSENILHKIFCGV